MNNLAKIEQRYTFMIKYHNDMNLIAFNDFSQRELNIFFSLCLLMKDKGTGEITLSYNDIKKIIPDRFESNKKFEEILESVYDKLLDVYKRQVLIPAGNLIAKTTLSDVAQQQAFIDQWVSDYQEADYVTNQKQH